MHTATRQRVAWWVLVKLALTAGWLIGVTGCKLDALATPCERREDTRYVPVTYPLPNGGIDTVLTVQCEGPYKRNIFR